MAGDRVVLLVATSRAGRGQEPVEAFAPFVEDSRVDLPKVREAAKDTLIVADGTSCRHQIQDGAQREAVHVARLLAEALG